MERRRFLGLSARALTLGYALGSPFGAAIYGQESDGDGGDSELAEPGGPPLERVPGLNAVEIRLGMSADFSGRSAAVSADALRGALAWLNEINSQGGIEGRRLTLLAQDDGGDPRRAVFNVRALLDEHEIFCLFNCLGTETLGRILPVIYGHRESDLWLLGEFSGAQAQRLRPFADQVLTVRASHRREMAALVAALQDVGASRFGLFYPINPHGRSGADAAHKAIEVAGSKLVGEATWRVGEDPGAYIASAVEHLKRSGADALVALGDGEVAVRFLAAAKAAGLNLPSGIGATLDSDGWYDQLDSFAGQSTLLTSRPMPFLQGASSPALTELRRLLDRWRPQPPPQLTSAGLSESSDGGPGAERLSAATLEGFLHARLLTAGLRLAGPWPTRRSVLAGLETLRGYDLGVGDPLDLHDPETRGLRRAYVGRWRDGRWRPISPPETEDLASQEPELESEPGGSAEGRDLSAPRPSDSSPTPLNGP